MDKTDVIALSLICAVALVGISVIILLNGSPIHIPVIGIGQAVARQVDPCAAAGQLVARTQLSYDYAVAQCKTATKTRTATEQCDRAVQLMRNLRAYQAQLAGCQKQAALLPPPSDDTAVVGDACTVDLSGCPPVKTTPLYDQVVQQHTKLYGKIIQSSDLALNLPRGLICQVRLPVSDIDTSQAYYLERSKSPAGWPCGTVGPNSKTVCSDSDFGKSEFVAGYITTPVSQKPEYDKCFESTNGWQVSEMNCDSINGVSTPISCPVGCKNGQCDKLSMFDLWDFFKRHPPTLVVGAQAPGTDVVSAVNLQKGLQQKGVTLPTPSTLLDTELGDPSLKVTILVGSPCNNKVTLALLGNPSPCDSGIPVDKGIIKLIRFPNGNIAVIIAARTPEQTRTLIDLFLNLQSQGSGTYDQVSDDEIRFTISPTCSNNKLDVGEADVDCGGACSPCPSGKTCTFTPDCASGLQCSDQSKTCAICTANMGQTCGCGGAVQCDGTCTKSLCSAGTACTNGACMTVCAPNSGSLCGCDGMVKCDGTCSHTCAPGQTCTMGICSSPCSASQGQACGTCSTGRIDCSGSCVGSYTPSGYGTGCGCGGTIDCAGNCQNGYCAPQPQNCNSNPSMCSSSQRCVNGQCQERCSGNVNFRTSASPLRDHLGGTSCQGVYAPGGYNPMYYACDSPFSFNFGWYPGMTDGNSYPQGQLCSNGGQQAEVSNINCHNSGGNSFQGSATASSGWIYTQCNFPSIPGKAGGQGSDTNSGWDTVWSDGYYQCCY